MKFLHEYICPRASVEFEVERFAFSRRRPPQAFALYLNCPMMPSEFQILCKRVCHERQEAILLIQWHSIHIISTTDYRSILSTNSLQSKARMYSSTWALLSKCATLSFPQVTRYEMSVSRCWGVWDAGNTFRGVWQRSPDQMLEACWFAGICNGFTLGDVQFGRSFLPDWHQFVR